MLEWRAPQERYAVQVAGGGAASAGAGLLVRPECLVRCACPFDALPLECLAACLSKLPRWTDAARAWAVHSRWRAALRDGAWPRCASVTLVPPAHWKAVRTFGHDWAELRPYAHPRAWAGPDATPSWLSALHGFPQPLRGACEGPAAVLRWLDRMGRDWHSVALTRWSGVARRLAWARGEPDPDLRVSTLHGNMDRPTLSAKRARPCCYRSGAETLTNARAHAPPCLFQLPADAALFWALMPEGFGEHESCEGLGHFNGLEVDLAPWQRTPSHPERQHGAAKVERVPPEILGCDPAKLLDVAHRLLQELNLFPGLKARRREEADHM